MIPQELQQRVNEISAGVAASVSGVSTAASFWALANDIAQFCAAVVAIISGLAAAYYYLKRARSKR